ncbi:ketopantoate reductase family protein [Streptomyces hydrogenans]|uniref:ketopantoate reductase family protein n=1 Tax=Streptomyces hydrogenans TaxID=1873719 RepID=UPI00278C4492|nr:ketopantoate reductase family protein [Streptomyces hydrogenans]
MKILVVGAGATGGYFGTMLARSGQDVTFLVRPGRAAALRAGGLRVAGRDEEWVLDAPRLVTAGEKPSGGPYDLVLLGVKSTALDAALADLAPYVSPGTAVLPLLNGMAHLDALDARFGAGAVLGGVAKVVTTLDDSGTIRRLAPLAHLALGERDGSLSPRVKEIRTVLEDAGIDAPVPASIVTAMWHKWVFITTIGAVTSLMRGTVGEVYDAPGGPELGPAVLAEGATVAAAAGHPVPEAERAASLAVVSAPGSPMVPSLYRDLAAGRSTEVEHLFGDLTARARALGVPTPLLDLATLHLRIHQRRIDGAGRGQ